jgi:hypothetical protein
VGRSIKMIEGPLTQHGTLLSLYEALGSGAPMQCKLVTYRADGRPLINHIRAVPVQGDLMATQLAQHAEGSGSSGSQLMADVSGVTHCLWYMETHEPALHADAMSDAFSVLEVNDKWTDSWLVERRVFADDVAEMKFLRESLGCIVPRAPATETALVRLWSAFSEKTAPIEDSVLDWMVCDDSHELAMPVCAQGEFECLCPVKDKDSSADETLSKFGERPILAQPSRAGMNVHPNASSKGSDVASDVKTGVENVIVCKPRLHDEAIDRLRALIRSHALSSVYVQDLVNESSLSDTEDEAEVEMLELVQEMSREAMLEAERHEICQMFMGEPIHEAVASHCVISS